MVTHFAIRATLQNNGVPAVEHLGCVCVSTNEKVVGSIPGSSRPLAEASLAKILNPKLPPMHSLGRECVRMLERAYA